MAKRKSKPKRKSSQHHSLPRVTVIEVIGTDGDGELLGRPLNWHEQKPPPIIFINDQGPGALGVGDRALARLQSIDRDAYAARVIKRIAAAPKSVLGIFLEDNRIQSVNKRDRHDFVVEAGDALNAKPGDMVAAEVLSKKRLGLPRARIVEVIAPALGSSAFSRIAIQEYDLPTKFSAAAIELADAAIAPDMAGRADLRALPLITIDGEDAKDFDDAVWAESDGDGWHVIVAIADVAWYVRPGDALDRDAFQRGNSVYLPDTVLPMLPEPLSNGWCSLRPNEDRACLAAHLWIDSGGKLRRQRFERAMMRSAARLNYSQAQSAYDGKPDDLTAPLLDNVITPLYGAYSAMVRERDERSPLNLDIPERHIEFDQSGKVLNIAPRARLESHRLIEEFMIKANVAAALTLEKARTPCLYRIHDEPPADKLDSFREFVSSLGVKFPKGQVLAPGIFNRFLDQADQRDLGELASQVVLRSQSQAEYSERNHGHFGLGLAKYCHFTSPIRRYADLYIHRALISGLKLGDGGLDTPPIDLEDIGKRINATERLAVKAERDTVDRFTVAYLADHVGDRVMGRISGVIKNGLFLTLDGTLADGFVPARLLPDDRYQFNEKRRLLKGRHRRMEFQFGDHVEAIIREANPVSGSLTLEIRSQANN